MKYLVRVLEMSTKVYEVEADSKDEAKVAVDQMKTSNKISENVTKNVISVSKLKRQ